jgi:D-cysteine desulfhydrase
VGVVARVVVLAHDASLYQSGRTLRSIAAVFSPPPGRAAPLLFEAFPAMRAGVPWRPLCHVPTAVEPCEALTPWLGRGGVWAKRDDLISPVYGGNKVRRFEFLFADLAARNARRIVTAGGSFGRQLCETLFFLALYLAGRSFGGTALFGWTRVSRSGGRTAEAFRLA